LEGFVEPAFIYAGEGANFRRLTQRPPSALSVGRRKVEIVAHSSARCQVQKRDSNGKRKQRPTCQAHRISTEQNMFLCQIASWLAGLTLWLLD
jgi:hypothetical protein